MFKFIVGADIGGNDVKFGAQNKKGELLTPRADEILKLPSGFREGPQATLGVVRKVVEILENRIGGKASCLGLAYPGPADLNGRIGISTNGGEPWSNLNFRKMVEDELGLPTIYENDANAAAWAEYIRNVKNLELKYGPDSGALFTVGTGLGGGLISNGKLQRGVRGEAAEFGHVEIASTEGFVLSEAAGAFCGCGRKHCSEAYTNLGYLQREANYYLQTDSDLRNHPLQQVPAEGFTRAKMLLELAGKGDPLASTLLQAQALNLGVVMGNIMKTFDLSWLLIGGGITEGTEQVRASYLHSARQGMYPRIAETQHDVFLDFAKTGDNAGWIGVADQARLAFIDNKASWLSRLFDIFRT